MFKRIRMLALSLVALGALAFGGATLANAGNSSGEKPGQESSAPENSASDPDNVQFTPPGEAKSAAAKKQAHRSHARQRGHKRHARHAQAETQGESPETQDESGSETPGNDGPGGHADEPGNPNADHQHEGQE